MSDITETIQETVEKAGESKLNAKIALLVAITATFGPVTGTEYALGSCTMAGAAAGVQVLRVHDVRETVQALAVAAAISGAGAGA